MVVIIFDTFGGLCNQFYDIITGINYCFKNNIKFTFRNCSFRNNNLVSWESKNFDDLFDKSFLLKNYNRLYIDIKNIHTTCDNTENYLSKNCYTIFDKNNFDDIIKNCNKTYIIIKACWSIFGFDNLIYKDIHKLIFPSKKLMDLYENIKSKILNKDENYNFIHYRYERDFTSHFKLNNIENLKDLIIRIKVLFKNTNLRIYIATSKIKNIININDPEIQNIIVTKNEDDLINYNFEELAFVDYMFGFNSNEIFGHSNSSFSKMLNTIKNTNNYYNN